MSLHCVFSKLYFTELWKTKYILISLPFLRLASPPLNFPHFASMFFCYICLSTQPILIWSS